MKSKSAGEEHDEMLESSDLGEGTVGEAVGSMLGMKRPFDAETGLPAAPPWPEDTLDPKAVHAYLCALARDDAARDYVRGRWFLKGMAARVWEPLGMASFAEYAERQFGFSPRKTWETLRVARALEELPRTAAAIERGELHWSVVRELTRVVVPETEARWLEAAQGKTVREVEKLVAQRDRGDEPRDPPNRRTERTVLRFDVNAETRALLDQARTTIVRDAGHGLSDDEVLQLMARIVLGQGGRGHGGGARRRPQQLPGAHDRLPAVRGDEQRGGGG